MDRIIVQDLKIMVISPLIVIVLLERISQKENQKKLKYKLNKHAKKN